MIGHRGASAHAPENSLEAFRRAAADGADGVELDVLCCGSGEVVVFHDDDLRRLAGRPERVDALPLPALREVRLASGVCIPTLDEALEVCGPDLLVNIELKAGTWLDGNLAALVEGVSAIVDRAGAAARTLVSSFSPMAVWRWRSRRPDVKAALLFEPQASRPLRRAWALPLLRPFAVHPERSFCTAPAVRRWHGRGYAVNTWTVDDAAGLRELRNMGVDGIFTNDPAAAGAILRNG